MRNRYNQFDSTLTLPKRNPKSDDRFWPRHEFKCTVYYRDCDPDSTTGGDFGQQVAYWYGPWEDAPLEPADDAWTDLSVRLKDPRWPGTDKFDRTCDAIAQMIIEGSLIAARVQLYDHREVIDKHDLESLGKVASPVQDYHGAMDFAELAMYRARVRRSAGYGPDDEDEALAWDDADRIVDIDDSPSVDVDDMTLFPGSYL